MPERLDVAGADTSDPTALLATLRGLETELHHPGSTSDAVRLGQLLHPDFHEVGKSGRPYTREHVIAHLSDPHAPRAAVVPDSHAVALVAPGCALLTFRTTERAPDAGGTAVVALRSSVWLHTAAGWQLRYHQGTVVPPG